MDVISPLPTIEYNPFPSYEVPSTLSMTTTPTAPAPSAFFYLSKVQDKMFYFLLHVIVHALIERKKLHLVAKFWAYIYLIEILINTCNHVGKTA